MTRATHFGLHPWNGWKRPMKPWEWFTHGPYRIESRPNRYFAVRDDRNGNEFDVVFRDDGVDVDPTCDFLHFGGMSEFDELRDLITFLRGKVMA